MVPVSPCVALPLSCSSSLPVLPLPMLPLFPTLPPVLTPADPPPPLPWQLGVSPWAVPDPCHPSLDGALHLALPGRMWHQWWPRHLALRVGQMSQGHRCKYSVKGYLCCLNGFLCFMSRSFFILPELYFIASMVSLFVNCSLLSCLFATIC